DLKYFNYIPMKTFHLRSLIAFFLVLFSFLTVSCKDDDEKVDPKTPASEAAIITFTSPAMHSVYNQGQIVTVAGKIEAEKEIHGYKIIIRNKTANTETVIKDDHAHGTQVDFSAEWPTQVSQHADMEAEVIVTLDHNDNTISKKVGFHCMP